MDDIGRSATYGVRDQLCVLSGGLIVVSDAGRKTYSQEVSRDARRFLGVDGQDCAKSNLPLTNRVSRPILFRSKARIGCGSKTAQLTLAFDPPTRFGV